MRRAGRRYAGGSGKLERGGLETRRRAGDTPVTAETQSKSVT